MLKESHILQAEERYLVVRLFQYICQPYLFLLSLRLPYLMGDLEGRVFTFQPSLETVLTSGSSLLALNAVISCSGVSTYDKIP